MNLSEPGQRAANRRINIRIDTAALASNLQIVKRHCPRSKIFAVIKTDAYGHGATPCAEVLSAAGADGFAVVFPGEAIELREAGITHPILVLQGPGSAQEVRLFAEWKLCAVIHDSSQLPWLADLPTNTQLKVWLKVDTGMGRMGFAPTELACLLAGLKQHSNLHCLGILSHLACADEAGNAHTEQQIATFDKLAQSVQTGRIGLYRSLANSAAVMAWPRASYDWVRPGIMLYGANPLMQTSPDTESLLPVMQVSAPLAALKLRQRGDGIGYGQSYTCPETMSVGYAAIGYGDGLPRNLSGAKVLVRGKTVPIVGRVSMDSIALDLRGVEAAVGEQVIIWGPGNPVENLASVAGTISYELLCAIRGKRHYVSAASSH